MRRGHWALVAVMGSLIGVAMAQEKTLSTPVENMAYASIRIVRQTASDIESKPLVKVPAGYSLMTSGDYAVSSPSEYYVFLRGPKGVARGVVIEWAGEKVVTVLHNHDRLPMRHEESGTVSCDVPVTAGSAREAWTTLETWSWLDEPGLWFALHHNDPTRRCGYYLEKPWVKGEAAAGVNYLIAARMILRDWGLPHQISSDGAGQMALMGFETNNPLHGDSPPHWHLAYFWPDKDGKPSWGAPGSQVPHLYIDSKGCTFENGFMIAGQKRRTYKAAQPVEFKDPAGNVRLDLQILEDGGIALGPKTGTWTYSMRAGDEETGFAKSIRVLKNGEPWRRVTCVDDTRTGVTEIRLDALDGGEGSSIEIVRYDPLTGIPARP